MGRDGEEKRGTQEQESEERPNGSFIVSCQVTMGMRLDEMPTLLITITYKML